MMMEALPLLPAELLSQIFLQVDPHTLYTSVRCLSRQWKEEVESNLLRKEFTSGRWRVGLRVNRKPKVGKAWRGGIAGGSGDQAPGAAWESYLKRIDLEYADATEQEQIEARLRAKQEYNRIIHQREGVLEDEMACLLMEQASAPLSHVLPLQFDHYDRETAMLRFDTGNDDWYALFEGAEEGSNSRLDLDFSIVWRFPGDGQSDDESDGWGVPDQENGWLSRFFCSSFDIRTDDIQEEGSKRLHSTPLARRIRKRIQGEDRDADVVAGSAPLEWSDQGHEYMCLSLSLGTEFFVRRSAQANILTRRLEAAAQADDERRRLGKGKAQRRIFSSGATSMATTPTNGPQRRRAIDPFNRLQCDTRSTAHSGASTPLIRSATYASIASTPSSGASSPIGGSSISSKGPRIAKLSRRPTHSRAPFPSANVSGYSSVLHKPKVNEKLAELCDEADEGDKIDPDVSSSCSRMEVAGCNSSVQSCPRAFFSAQLYSAESEVKSGLQWVDENGTLPLRLCALNSTIPLTIWQWSR